MPPTFTLSQHDGRRSRPNIHFQPPGSNALTAGLAVPFQSTAHAATTFNVNSLGDAQ